MNVALEDTEEWAGGKITARYGDCFLRGNNGESRAARSALDFSLGRSVVSPAAGDTHFPFSAYATVCQHGEWHSWSVSRLTALRDGLPGGLSLDVLDRPGSSLTSSSLHLGAGGHMMDFIRSRLRS